MYKNSRATRRDRLDNRVICVYNTDMIQKSRHEGRDRTLDCGGKGNEFRWLHGCLHHVETVGRHSIRALPCVPTRHRFGCGRVVAGWLRARLFFLPLTWR